MASASNGIDITYEGTYATKMLLEPIFHSDDIMANYTVYPNVKFKQNILTAGSLSKIVRSNTGCSNSDNSGTGLTTSFEIGDKQIEVANCSVKMSQCWDTFYNEFIVESYQAGINMPDLTGTELAKVIADRVTKGLMSDVVRVMWGGDTASSDVTYSWRDGLFKLYNAGSVTPVTQAVSSGTGQTAVGGTLVQDDVMDLLAKLFDSADAKLQQLPASEKKIFVTPNIYNTYYGALTLVAQTGAVDYGHSEAQSGVNYGRLRYRGIEIIPIYEFDTILTDLDPAILQNGGVEYKNVAVYTAKANIMIGSDVTDPEAQFKMFYDNVSDNMYIRSYFKMGYQYGFNSLVNVGFLIN